MINCPIHNHSRVNDYKPNTLQTQSSALVLACLNGYSEMALDLIQAGANVNTCDEVFIC